jgi:hypothetical protein
VPLLEQTEDRKVYGPYMSNTIGRRIVVIRYADRKTSMTYARWLLQTHLGRELARDEEADHINEDGLDDRIENLQVLTKVENIRKSARPIEWIVFLCPVCGSEAKKEARYVRHNRKQGKAGPFCGRSCARAWQLTGT